MRCLRLAIVLTLFGSMSISVLSPAEFPGNSVISESIVNEYKLSNSPLSLLISSSVSDLDCVDEFTTTIYVMNDSNETHELDSEWNIPNHNLTFAFIVSGVAMNWSDSVQYKIGGWNQLVRLHSKELIGRQVYFVIDHGTIRLERPRIFDLSISGEPSLKEDVKIHVPPGQFYMVGIYLIDIPQKHIWGLIESNRIAFNNRCTTARLPSDPSVPKTHP